MSRLPASLSGTVSPRTRRAGVAGAFLYLLVLLVPAFWLRLGVTFLLTPFPGALFTTQVGPLLWWGFYGAGLLGACLGIALIRYRLRSPALVVAALFGFALFETWQALQGSAPLMPGSPYDLYFIGWPVTLGLAGAVGVVEWFVRKSVRPDGE